MLTPRQHTRLSQLFSLADADDSGSVEFTDLETIAHKTLQSAGHKEGSILYEGADAMLRQFWSGFTDVADINRDDAIDESEWLACWETQLDGASDPDFDELPALVRQIHLLCAQALGINANRGADLDAYRRCLNVIGVTLAA